ncbi:MAG TPA: class I SAM-dependent methyltransferase [Candidatus Hydrogenedentes bacterium]|nr:class I SAM-dependent methyltransferase [Candidatus Hydrogenedentota bacterium]
MNAFDRGAAYYEAFANATQRLRREGPFLLEQLQRAPGNRVLDMACGTGPHALFFAENGADVTAIDFSETMLAYAKEHRPHPHITYTPGDMRAATGGPYDLALCLGNSLCLLNTENDLHAAFIGVFKALSPGGLFVTQTLNYSAPAAREPRHRIERAKIGDEQVVAVKSLVPDENHTLLSLNYFAHTPEGYETISEATMLRNWTEEELLDIARDAGFASLEVFGSCEKKPFEPEGSTDILLVLRKSEKV